LPEEVPSFVISGPMPCKGRPRQVSDGPPQLM